MRFAFKICLIEWRNDWFRKRPEARSWYLESISMLARASRPLGNERNQIIGLSHFLILFELSSFMP